MSQVNLTAVPLDDNQYLLECEECGIVGTEDPDQVDGLAFTHLVDVHHVDTMTWTFPPP